MGSDPPGGVPGGYAARTNAILPPPSGGRVGPTGRGPRPRVVEGAGAERVRRRRAGQAAQTEAPPDPLLRGVGIRVPVAGVVVHRGTRRGRRPRRWGRRLVIVVRGSVQLGAAARGGAERGRCTGAGVLTVTRTFATAPATALAAAAPRASTRLRPPRVPTDRRDHCRTSPRPHPYHRCWGSAGGRRCRRCWNLRWQEPASWRRGFDPSRGACRRRC